MVTFQKEHFEVIRGDGQPRIPPLARLPRVGVGGIAGSSC